MTEPQGAFAVQGSAKPEHANDPSSGALQNSRLIPPARVPSASVMVWPLNSIVPAFSSVEITLSPVRLQVQPSPILTAMLSPSISPPAVFSTMLIEPVRHAPSVRLSFSVEISSTVISPARIWLCALKVTFAPLAPAVPQPRAESLPSTVRSLPFASVSDTFSREITLSVLVT